MHNRNRWILRDMSRQFTNIVPHQPMQPDEMRPIHVPWLMLLISFVQLAIQIYIYALKHEDNVLYTIFQFQRDKKIQIWRFVTYMLVHSSFEHCLGNLMLQLILGIALEIYNGWWRVLIVYLAGGIAGCLGHGVFMDTSLRGASGGDFALLSAHIASVVIVSVTTFYIFSILMYIFLYFYLF
jgi:membrane associated rhomboid family serine protease